MTIYFLIVESLDCKDKKKGESLKSKGKNFSRTETRSCTEPANFQLSIFNSIETQQLHRVYFHRCNWYVSTLIFNFQFSTFNFQL